MKWNESVLDPYRIDINTDPDPAFKVNTDPDPEPGFSWPTFYPHTIFYSLFSSRIDTVFKPPSTTFRFKSKHETPQKCFQRPLETDIFSYYQSVSADFSSSGSVSGSVFPIRIPIQEIQLNTDPDPGCNINTDPHRSGSETRNKSW